MSAMSFAHQHADIAALSARDRYRSLRPRDGLDFASNDYLGLASDPALRAAVTDALDRGVPVGAGGSRLLRGNHAEHETLEAEAAAFFGTESALYFSTGFAANSALLSTMPVRGDLIVYDALIHASAYEGMRLSRADRRVAAHNDADAFADAISKWRGEGGVGTVWIAVESLYSMDGDRAPLDALAEAAARHDAILMIDEAHATGVFGRDGRGLADTLSPAANVITLRTCGKALGCEGALVCGPSIVSDMMINRGRGFIFSTAPSPLMAAAVRASLRLIASQPERRQSLAALIDHAAQKLEQQGAKITGSQIMPLILGSDTRTMAVASALQSAGFDVRGIRPPTVPAGTSRLRISLTLNVSMADVDSLAGALAEALQ